jgi:hypothetical protein
MYKTSYPKLAKLRVFLLEETLNPGFKGLVVDRKRGLIKNVKVLGLVSLNGRRYTPEAVKAAAPLYEGVKVNVNHPKKPSDQRDARDRIGKLVNIRFVENRGLYGDLMLLKEHDMSAKLFEAAERMPDTFGLSHNARGDGESRGGVFVVTEIVEVRHVDIVGDGVVLGVPEDILHFKIAEKQKKAEVKP